MKTWGVLRSPSAEKIWKVALPTGDYEDHTINYLPKSLGIASTTRMSQEVSKRLGSVGYNPNISHL